MDLVRLAMRQQLHPELDMHPSWLPERWPARYRGMQHLNESGQAVVSEWVRRELGDEVPAFDTPLRRMALSIKAEKQARWATRVASVFIPEKILAPSVRPAQS